jgi:transcriptional regulator with XRE-family HTH domain
MSNYRDDIPLNSLRLRDWALKESSQDKGMSQNKLAFALGVDRTTISNWCKSGRESLQKKSMVAIAKYMDISVEDAIKYFQVGMAEKPRKIKTSCDNDKIDEIESNVSALSDRLDTALTLLEVLGSELKQIKKSLGANGTNAIKVRPTCIDSQ